MDKKIRSLVITGFGINCEEELAAAYKLAGAEPEIVHLNYILSGRVSVHDYDIINFPGGFSFGDDIASGKVLANKIRFKKLLDGTTFFDALKTFLSEGKVIIGICNGFQLLVRLGMLPNTSGKWEQEASLIKNDSGNFIDNWVTLKVKGSKSPFLNGITELDLPIRHGEGKLVFANDEIRKDVLNNELACLFYADNPNGSEFNIAGLTDTTGQVFGLMPHPEAYLSIYNHPDRNRMTGLENEEGEGILIFRNIVNHILKKRRRDESI